MTGHVNIFCLYPQIFPPARKICGRIRPKQIEKEIERELEQYLKEGNESKTGTTLDKLFKDIEKVLPIRIECMELLYSDQISVR